MAKTKQKPDGPLTRINPIVAEKVVVDLVDLQADLRRNGVRVSQSALIEVAIKGFTERELRDVMALVLKHGAKLKRDRA